jgi:hypothetical protein
MWRARQLVYARDWAARRQKACAQTGGRRQQTAMRGWLGGVPCGTGIACTVQQAGDGYGGGKVLMIGATCERGRWRVGHSSDTGYR